MGIPVPYRVATRPELESLLLQLTLSLHLSPARTSKRPPCLHLPDLLIDYRPQWRQQSTLPHHGRAWHDDQHRLITKNGTRIIVCDAPDKALFRPSTSARNSF